MDTEQLKQQCLDRLRVLYPEPWFVWWGIGTGVHCEEAMAFVRPHGERSTQVNVSDGMALPELLAFLLTSSEVDAEASVRQSGNYVADDPVHPTIVWFANGRVVRLQGGENPYLGVGTDFRERDTIFDL